VSWDGEEYVLLQEDQCQFREDCRCTGRERITVSMDIM
jgi:hypothetical protein